MTTIPPDVPIGLYWYCLPDGAWVRAYIAGGRLYRLAPTGEGIPLALCSGALHGPLVQPGTAR